MSQQAVFEIHRGPKGNLDSVTVFMPEWAKIADDGSKVVNLPFLGLKFYTFNHMNPNEIAHDVIKGFCINSDKFGLSLETELLGLGWTTKNNSTFIWGTDNFVFDQIVHTGEDYQEKIEFQQELELV